MSLSVNSIKSQSYNTDYLKTVRNLQSLGVAPTGNDTHDRQNLQVAEYDKKKDTLSGSNAASLGNAQTNFQATIQQVQGANGVNGVQGVNSSNAISGLSASSVIQPTQATDTSNQTSLAEQQIGATQLGELNKLKLGLIAA